MSKYLPLPSDLCPVRTLRCPAAPPHSVAATEMSSYAVPSSLLLSAGQHPERTLLPHLQLDQESQWQSEQTGTGSTVLNTSLSSAALRHWQPATCNILNHEVCTKTSEVVF